MRLVNRGAVLFLGSIVSMGLVACGGDDGGGGDDVITGDDHTYVVSKVKLPATGGEATMLGLDIDGDGTADNQFGNFLAGLAGASGLDLQGPLDESVDQGSVILLANLKATDLTNASGAGMWVYIGDNPTPAACTDPNDTTCRHHLDGTGMFGIKAGTDTSAKLAGRIMAGTFTGGPGTVNLQLSLSAGSAPLELPLQQARAEIKVTATGISAGSKIGGAVAQTDIETKIHPVIQNVVADLVTADCPNTAPPCGCTAGSTGENVLSLLDGNGDCVVSLEEVRGTLNGLLTDDIDLDGDGQNDAVSIGIGIQAVQGTFTVP